MLSSLNADQQKFILLNQYFSPFTLLQKKLFDTTRLRTKKHTPSECHSNVVLFLYKMTENYTCIQFCRNKHPRTVKTWVQLKNNPKVLKEKTKFISGNLNQLAFIRFLMCMSSTMFDGSNLTSIWLNYHMSLSPLL